MLTVSQRIDARTDICWVLRRSTISLSPCCVREESKRYEPPYVYVENAYADDGVVQGIDLLEAALKTSPSSVVVAEPFLFNLCAYLSFFLFYADLPLPDRECLYSHPIRASFDCRHRQEARALARSCKVERRWPQNVLLEDAFELRRVTLFTLY